MPWLRVLRLASSMLLAMALAAGTPVSAASDPGPSSGVVVDPAAQTTPSIDMSDPAPPGTSQRSGTGITPIFAPIPFKHTQLGWGLAVLVGAIHRFDPDTTIKPSTGGVTGFYSENKSWGWMIVEMARLQQDRWRLRGLAMHADVRYDFFGVGQDAGDAGLSVAIEQTMDVVLIAALRRVTPNLYGGGSLLWIRTGAELLHDHGLPAPPDVEDLATANLLAPGIQLEFDTRDDDYWPSRGSIATVKSNFFTSALGSDSDFERYMAAWCWYTSVRGPALLLAMNASVTAATGDVPFWAIPSVGAGLYGLRGYTQGRYRDNVVTTVQAELRAHSKGRLGATVFGGLAQVGGSVGDLWNAEVLPAGGAGVRYQLTREYPMHMRADYAWGKNGGIFYFSVSEAF